MIATLDYLRKIHDSPGCESTVIRLSDGIDDGKTLWVTTDPPQDRFDPKVEVCLSQLDPQTAKLKLTNYTAADYWLSLPPNTSPFPGTIPTSDDSLRRFASSVNSQVHRDAFTTLVPTAGAHVTFSLNDIPEDENGANWSVVLRSDPAVGQVVTITFVTGSALGLIDPAVGVASAIQDCVVSAINLAGRNHVDSNSAAEIALNCLPLSSAFKAGGPAAEWIKSALGNVPAFVKAFDSLAAFDSHPDVAVSLHKSSAPIPPVVIKTSDPALPMQPQQPLPQQPQQPQQPLPQQPQQPQPQPQQPQQPPQQPDGLPGGFVGQWSGSITQDNYARSPYPGNFSIKEGKVGARIATGSYPTLGCKVHWTLSKVQGDTIVVRETVDEGPECLNVDVALSLQSDGGMKYQFDGGAGRAVLRR